MKTIDEINFKGRTALVRVDFNVPLDETGQVRDDSRIVSALPTIRKILREGGKVVLMSHLGRPKDASDTQYSLKHILDTVSAHLGQLVQFLRGPLSQDTKRAVEELPEGSVCLLENLRFDPGETKGDPGVSRALAQLGDIFVFDAFGTAHRRHASTSVLARLMTNKCCGYLVKEEVENARKVMEKPRHPFTIILGGAKVSDKLQIIERLLDIADNLVVGGAMSYTFLKASGITVGASLAESDMVPVVRRVMEKAARMGKMLYLPLDHVISDEFGPNAQCRVTPGKEIDTGWMGMDIGSQTIRSYSQVVESSKTILWNGPLGVFEMEPFSEGTYAIGKAVAKATSAGCYSLIGGGDSVSAVRNGGLAKQVSYLSSGGGALLELFKTGTLPVIEALES